MDGPGPYPVGDARVTIASAATAVLPWLPPVGITGFVVAVLYAILRGWLVPKASVDARMAEMQQVAVLWRDAAMENRQLVAEMLPLVRQTVENDDLIIALVTALKESANQPAPAPPRGSGAL